jgi:ankyrin repeat protein
MLTITDNERLVHKINTYISTGDNVKVKNILNNSGVNVNTCDENGDIPLHMAISSKNQEALVMLLDLEGIDLNIKSEKFLNNSPLITAVISRNFAAFVALVYDDRSVNAINLEQTNDYRRSPLLECIILGLQDYFDVLIPELTSDYLKNVDQMGSSVITLLIKYGHVGYINTALAHFDMSSDDLMSINANDYRLTERNKHSVPTFSDKIMDQIFAKSRK